MASEFHMLSELIDSIGEALNESDINKVKSLLMNEAKRNLVDDRLVKILGNETELKYFIEQFKDARNLQIIFMIDITGSMANHYDNFKNHILGSIVEGVLTAVNRSTKNYAFVGYRERNEAYEFYQLTDNIESIRQAIRKVTPSGGGDEAEDVEFGLDLFVKNITFKGRGTRIIIHVADCPAHGKRYHNDNISDDHPSWSDNIPTLLNTTINLSCFYWFIKVTPHTDKMISEFNKILKEKSKSEGFDRVSVIDATDLKRDLTQKIKNLLRSTIFASALSK